MASVKTTCKTPESNGSLPRLSNRFTENSNPIANSNRATPSSAIWKMCWCGTTSPQHAGTDNGPGDQVSDNGDLAEHLRQGAQDHRQSQQQ